MNKYNGMGLDGRPMKITLTNPDFGSNRSKNDKYRPKRSFSNDKMKPKLNNRSRNLVQNTQRFTKSENKSGDLGREMKPKFNKRSRNLDQNAEKYTRPKTTSEDLDREMDDYMKSQLIKAKRFLAS